MRLPPGQSEATELTWRKTTLLAGDIDPDCQGETELLLPNGDTQDSILAPEGSPGHLLAPLRPTVTVDGKLYQPKKRRTMEDSEPSGRKVGVSPLVEDPPELQPRAGEAWTGQWKGEATDLERGLVVRQRRTPRRLSRLCTCCSC